jgi:hypothetical protein
MSPAESNGVDSAQRRPPWRLLKMSHSGWFEGEGITEDVFALADDGDDEDWDEDLEDDDWDEDEDEDWDDDDEEIEDEDEDWDDDEEELWD